MFVSLFLHVFPQCLHLHNRMNVAVLKLCSIFLEMEDDLNQLHRKKNEAFS